MGAQETQAGAAWVTVAGGSLLALLVRIPRGEPPGKNADRGTDGPSRI